VDQDVGAFVLMTLIVVLAPLLAPVLADRFAPWLLGLFGATQLPMVVAITTIGVQNGELAAGTAAARQPRAEAW